VLWELRHPRGAGWSARVLHEGRQWSRLTPLRLAAVRVRHLQPAADGRRVQHLRATAHVYARRVHAGRLLLLLLTVATGRLLLLYVVPANRLRLLPPLALLRRVAIAGRRMRLRNVGWRLPVLLAAAVLLLLLLRLPLLLL